MKEDLNRFDKMAEQVFQQMDFMSLKQQEMMLHVLWFTAQPWSTTRPSRACVVLKFLTFWPEHSPTMAILQHSFRMPKTQQRLQEASSFKQSLSLSRKAALPPWLLTPSHINN